MLGSGLVPRWLGPVMPFATDINLANPDRGVRPGPVSSTSTFATGMKSRPQYVSCGRS